MTRARGLLAVLIVLVGATGAGVVWWARNGISEDRGTSTYAGPATGVEVDLGSGRVDVVAGANDQVKVERIRRYLRGAPPLTETFEGGLLRVRAGSCPGIAALTCTVDVRVEVPATAAVRVRAGSGAVNVDGMVNGVDVATSAGAVRLARVGGLVRASTSGGSVVGSDLSPTALDAVSSGGAIRISLAQPAGRVDLRTRSGRIDLALPDAPGGYRVTTAAGGGKASVTVAQDPASDRAVTARTGGGRISIHPR